VCKKINRSHTHTNTPTENNTPDTDTPTHDNNNTPNPQTNTSHKHLTTLEGGAWCEQGGVNREAAQGGDNREMWIGKTSPPRNIYIQGSSP